MNTVRRLAVLTGLVTAIFAGTAIPASAAFSASKAVGTSITTPTVAAPANVSATNVGCLWGLGYARISWAPSTSDRVIGYTVTAHRNGGTTVVASPGATATSAETLLVGTTYYTVTTRTEYGWTAVSSQTPTISC